mgnify:CR=1 FL=1
MKITNVASVRHLSPFRYPGGKTWLIPRIREWLAAIKPRTFAEPFCGGAIVGLTVAAENLAEHVTLCELDDDVAAVWKIALSDEAMPLAERIMRFRVSEASVREVLESPSDSLLCKAFRTIIRNRMNRGGIMAPGAGLMKGGENGRGLLSRWYAETLCARIMAINELRDRITFLHRDYRESPPADAVFIDPPYTVAGRRLYAHNAVDHSDVFTLAAKAAGSFLMTYDNAPEIRSLAAIHGFATAPIAMKNTHHAIMSELLIGKNLNWLNGGET